MVGAGAAPREHAAQEAPERTSPVGDAFTGWKGHYRLSTMPLLPLVQSRTLGSLKVHALQAGLQQLDGGAMFGVVPKTLWERKIPADDRNRIPLGMRCLLVEHPDGLVLIDSGAGDKESEKFYGIYGIENSPIGGVGPTQLESALAQA